MSAPEKPLVERLTALLDEYDTAARGSENALLAGYVRAALSARDALEMRVTSEARTGRGGWPAEHAHRRGGRQRVVSMEPLHAHDPRPEVTRRLAVERRAACAFEVLA